MSYKSYLNQANLPRGFRNNNPGNLIKTDIPWEGKIPHSQNPDTRFEQFKELRYGIRALYRDLISDHKKGLTTVVGLINEYAPPHENETDDYIDAVIGFIGSNFIPELTEEIIVAISKAIVKHENGAKWTYLATDQDYQDAIAILGIPLKKKAMKVR